MARIGTVKVEVTPEIQEAIDQLVPVVRAADEYVRHREQGTADGDEYDRLVAAVQIYRRFQRDKKVKVVE